MTASVWVSLGSLGLLVIIQAVAGAFVAGKHSQRITNLERDVNDRASLNDKVIELTVKMGYVEDQVKKLPSALEGINRQLGNIAMNRVGLSGELK